MDYTCISMVTMNDVAKLAGVSIATVSNVINGTKKVSPDKERRVRDAISSLYYTPNTMAKFLRTNTNSIIGVIAEDIISYFAGNIIDGIADVCEQSGYVMNLCTLNLDRKISLINELTYKEMEESEEFRSKIQRNLSILFSSKPSGLIYVATYPRDVRHILPELNIPVVYAYAHSKKTDFVVNQDDFQGSKMAVEHLIENGHKKIALLCGSLDTVTYKRTLGAEAAMGEHNIMFNPNYRKMGSWLFEDGYNNCLELLSLPDPPTAIFSLSDVMAYGAIRACSERGVRIPEDISIHGFDGLYFSELATPSLTTTAPPFRDIGNTAAQTLINILEGILPSENEILLPCNHIIGDSVRNIGSK